MNKTILTYKIDIPTTVDVENLALTYRISFESYLTPLYLTPIGCKVYTSNPISYSPYDIVLMDISTDNEVSSGGVDYYRIVLKVESRSVGNDDLRSAWFSFVGAKRYSYTGQSPLYRKYNALHNYYDGEPASISDDDSYNSPVRSVLFGHTEKSVIDMKVQPAYDGSANIILTDNVNPIKLINSRFRVDDSGTIAYKSERRHRKDSNTYSDEEFHRTNLFPTYVGVPKLVFGTPNESGDSSADGVQAGGSLKGGGYRYFFRYVTQDGDETDIIAESRLVEVHFGDTAYTAHGAKDSESTSNSVKFTLSNLDKSFYGVKVYYTRSVGETEMVSEAFEIGNTYKINEVGQLEFLHTGYEPVISMNINELSINYSSISRSKTLDIVNNRLIVGNTTSDVLFSEDMSRRAALTAIGEATFSIKHNIGVKKTSDAYDTNYANPNFTYEHLGYWKGETYELGVVFVGRDGVSPVYPLHGSDAKNVARTVDVRTLLDPDYIGMENFGFNEDPDGYYQNSRGVYRTKFYPNYYSVRRLGGTGEGDNVEFEGTALRVCVKDLLGYPSDIKFATMDQTVSSNDPGFTLAYSDGEYYLFGKFTRTHALGQAFIISNYNGIPVPDPPVYIPFTNADGSAGSMYVGTSVNMYIYSGSGVSGTVLTDQDGVGPPRSDEYESFFFVRKKRKKDVLIDGIFTPAAAIPTTSSYTLSSTPLALPSYCGIGTESKLFGGNVSFVPAPACLMPFGSERPEQVDMLLRAPVKNFTKSKRLAFYSNDVDVAPQKYATIFTGGAKGIGVCGDSMSFKFESDVDVPDLSTPIPYAITLDALDSSIGTSLLRSMEATTTYTEAGALSSGGGGFSGKLDRNLAVAINKHPQHNVYRPGNYIQKDPTIRKNEIVTLNSNALFGDDMLSTDNNNSIYSSINQRVALSSSVKFGRYIGIHITDGWTSIFDEMNLPEVPFMRVYPADEDFDDPPNMNMEMSLKSSYTLTYSVDTEWKLGYNIKDDATEQNFTYTLTATVGTVSPEHPNHVDSIDKLFPEPGILLKINWGDGLWKYHTFDELLHTPGYDIHYFGIFPQPPQFIIDAGVPVELNSSNTKVVTQNKSYGLKGFIFDGLNSNHLSRSEWSSRYMSEDDTTYMAISDRLSVYDYAPVDGSATVLDGLKSTEVDLYGGDCYLGLAWKQVWFPIGIEEAPQTNDPEPYYIDRKALGLLSYGFAIPIPAQHNYNFNIRTLERNSDSEYKIFGRDRTFLPVKPTIRGDRQIETGTYNHGYSGNDYSAHSFFRIDSNVPFVRTSYPNRVFASDAQEDTQFSNGFKVFKGLSFRDYNYDMGPITKILSHRAKTYIVLQNGISVIGVDERSMVGEGGTDSIYIDNVDVLPLKSLPLSQKMGSQHLRSIARTEQYIYGVDVFLENVWRVSSTKVESISDMKVQSVLGTILSDYKSRQTADDTIDVFTTVDSQKGDVYFTISLTKLGATTESSTLVFSERLDRWVTKTDDDRKFFFNSNGDRIAFSTSKDTESMYIYDNRTIDDMQDVYNRFFGEDYPAVFSFYINHSLEEDKKLNNFIILGDGDIPVSVSYNAEMDMEPSLIQPISQYTNISYVIPSITFSGTVGERYGTISASTLLPHSGSPLKPGNSIKVGIDEYTVMNVVGGTKIMLSRPLVRNYAAVPVRFGVNTSLRLANAIREIGKIKIVCTYNGAQVSYKFRPEGDWIEPEFTYTGNYKLNINSIASMYNVDFS